MKLKNELHDISSLFDDGKYYLMHFNLILDILHLDNIADEQRQQVKTLWCYFVVVFFCLRTKWWINKWMNINEYDPSMSMTIANISMAMVKKLECIIFFCNGLFIYSYLRTLVFSFAYPYTFPIANCTNTDRPWAPVLREHSLFYEWMNKIIMKIYYIFIYLLYRGHRATMLNDVTFWSIIRIFLRHLLFFCETNEK